MTVLEFAKAVELIAWWVGFGFLVISILSFIGWIISHFGRFREGFEDMRSDCGYTAVIAFLIFLCAICQVVWVGIDLGRIMVIP